MGQQKTTLSRSIEVAVGKETLDAACKEFLAEKIILAWIMKHTMKEYAECDVWEIAKKYIIGEPQIGEVLVLPDETNAPRIAGVGVEDSSITEGTVTYDIHFRALLPGTREAVHLIINVEAQKDFYPGYPLVKRGIYYCARMVSSQYGTVFTNSHYEKIQKVYSIWICINPPKNRSNTITEYSFAEKNLAGNAVEKKKDYDLMTAVMICLGTREDAAGNELLGLLDVLLSSDKGAAEKKGILEMDYKISMTEELKGETERMCNYSDYVEERGIEKGIKIGMEKGISALAGLVRDNLLSVEEAAKRMGMSVEEFQMALSEV